MVLLTLYGFYWIFILAFWVLSSIAFYKMAKQAGRLDIAFFAWIPILAQILQLRLIQKSGWWVLMYLVPVANLVFSIIWRVQLLRAFGKHGAFVLFYVFLSPVYLILWMVWAFTGDIEYRIPPNGNKSSNSFTI